MGLLRFKKNNDNKVNPTSTGLFARLKNGLGKTHRALINSLSNVILGKKEIDQSLLEEIENILLSADVGVEVTQVLLSNITEQLDRKELADSFALLNALKESMICLLKPVEFPLIIDPKHRPYVILIVGVNGTGKTTTIAKLTHHLKMAGKTVMLAAGDTFRAAAIEQLQEWGKRYQVPVIAQQSGSDSASVIFDAVQSARTKEIDVIIADTAGRLHTQSHLMEELKKIVRVLKKLDVTAPHETILILDATIGQNALIQAREFKKAVEVSGIVLSKLDGTAKGGIIFAIAKQMALPIRYIGVGEKAEDLQSFSAETFVNALFDT